MTLSTGQCEYQLNNIHFDLYLTYSYSFYWLCLVYSPPSLSRSFNPIHMLYTVGLVLRTRNTEHHQNYVCIYQIKLSIQISDTLFFKLRSENPINTEVTASWYVQIEQIIILGANEHKIWLGISTTKKRATDKANIWT